MTVSNDHPLLLLYKMVTNETTLYSYRNQGARVEVTVSHGHNNVWFMTVRMITMEERAFISDILWKYEPTKATEVDWKFSVLCHHINGGMTPSQLTAWLFVDNWGCVILDELNPIRIEGV